MNFNLKYAVELVDLIDAAYDLFDAIKERRMWSYAGVDCADPKQVLELFTNPKNFPLIVNGIRYQILAVYPIQELQAKTVLSLLEVEIEKLIEWLLKDKKITFGFITSQEEQKNVYVVFRGTETPLEWFQDGEINQVPCSVQNWGKTTSGIQEIYQGISPTITEIFNHNPYLLDYQIFVTGHSLGGALASLCIPDLVNNTKINKLPILYTFASPRTGDSAFAKQFENQKIECYRVANTEDIVPTLPLATFKLTQKDPWDFGYVLTSLETKIAIRSLNQCGFFEHIGIPVYFTVQKNTVSDNHNLQDTYRNAMINLHDTEIFSPLTPVLSH